jgi:4'-phosphopantetheinyl transferase EntD
MSGLSGNPASLSAELAALFPAGVVAAELKGAASRDQLTPAELQSIAHCAEKRIQDFTVGRTCAHRALSKLGVVDFSLLAGPKREPIWPPGIVGSITHTTGYGAAVVARQQNVRSVGIDCEVIDSVDEDLWSQICTPSEIERLGGLPPDQRLRHGALIFAAKEAFYKCQFPLTRAWVGFEDVDIELAGASGFRIVPRKPLPLDERIVAGLVCRYEFRPTWVLAGVAVPALR